MTDISHLKLVKRFCVCGCGEHFKCLPTSKQKFWSLWHDKNSRFDGRLNELVPASKWMAERARRREEIKRARISGLQFVKLIKGKAA